MPDYLETTVDKFTFKVATDRLYTAEGVWAQGDGGRVRVGVTDYVQQRSGDVAFAEVKPAGTARRARRRAGQHRDDQGEHQPGRATRRHAGRGQCAAGDRPGDDQHGSLWRGLAGRDRAGRLGDRPGAPARPGGLFRDHAGAGREGGAGMSDQPHKVVIVPCSGIGKTYGTVSREAAYDLVEDLRPETTELVALSLLVLGDERARATVAACPAVTIDGCKLACATKMVSAERRHGRAQASRCWTCTAATATSSPRASPS